jgi:hypothetical protein
VKYTLAIALLLWSTTVEAAMYDKLKAMDPAAAAGYVYDNYKKIGQDPEVQRWINENAALYAETVKMRRQTPRQGG